MDQRGAPPDPRGGALSSRLQRPDSGVWGVPPTPGLAGIQPGAPAANRCPACGATNADGAEDCTTCGVALIDPLEHDTAGSSTKIGLRKGQQLYIQSQHLGWMTANVTVAAVDGSDPWQAFCATEGRPSLPLYRLGVSSNVGRLLLAGSMPGAVHALEVSKGIEYLVKGTSLLAAQESVTLGPAHDLQRPHGEPARGAVVQWVGGRGLIFIQTCGETVVYPLQQDEVLKVNIDNLACMDATVRFTLGSAPFTDIETVDLLGPGRVWLQTHSSPRVAAPTG